MNVYQKLQKCRVELQAQAIKATGENKFAGYTYVELSDFLPAVNLIFEVNGLCSVVEYGKEEATLTVIDMDKPDDKIVFRSPMSTAELKGCHPVQNLGAVQSYLRRYLYLACMEIVEHDALDSTHGRDTKDEKQGAKFASQCAAPAGKDAEYQAKVKNALKTIFGEDKTAALDEVERLTTFKGKGGKEVSGVRDFTKLSGKRLEILAHNLERMEKEFIPPVPEICQNCRTEPCSCEDDIQF